jgi:transposase InsO family protein
MTITMNDSRLGSIAEIQEFLKVSSALSFKGSSRKEQCVWIEEILRRFKYPSLRKKEKSIIKTYLMKMTGISDAQMTRYIGRYKKTGKVVFGITSHTQKRRGKHSFPTLYTSKDISLLCEVDNAHSRLSGPATKKILTREYTVFRKEDFTRLKDISSSHIYNLRKKRQYTSHATTYAKTQSVSASIGVRRKPHPEGKPGYIRVDTVHQGDKDKEKGVYHVNLIDEVTQWEIVVSVEKISERYLAPVLEKALLQFPFHIINFHSDNGSEYINRIVEKLLNKLLISQTKSRSRKSNDQALVEGKNGGVIRKHMGHTHIPQKYAECIDRFYREWFNVYINYHRPCGFSSTYVDKKGKEKKRYDTYMTPFEKLCSLEACQRYLKDDVSL